MPRELCLANTMRRIAAKYLFWILAAWIGAGCMTLPSTGVAAERKALTKTSVESGAAFQVTSATMPDRHGNGDDSLILDDSSAVDSDAAAPMGLVETQSFVLAGEIPHQRIEVYKCVRPWLTTSFVEPRFLRYARLLN